MSRQLKRASFLFVICAVFVLGVATVAASSHEALEDPIPEAIETGALEVRLQTVATGLTAPNWGAAVPGCENLSHRLLVTDQDGILWAVNLATGGKEPLLDVSDRLVALGAFGPGTFDERGLLGVALHPDFANNGLLYTYTSQPVDGAADFSTMPAGETPNHQAVVTEWQVAEPCNPASVVDVGSAREILRVDEPQFNHNAGALNFGPDGMLYIALGDGGAADDQGVGHVDGGNGQEPGNILGTIVRIDPQGTDGVNGQYGVPADNPFVGDADALDEIWAFGFRNPFRFSFDAETGAMYIGDVGQNDIEEVDVGVAGGNFGWNIKEGSFCFDPNGADPGFVFDCQPGDDPGGLIDPIAEYDHDEGISVIGGFVYRGAQLPWLQGHYVFGDFREAFGQPGRLFYLDDDGEIREFQLEGEGLAGRALLGFGQDATGELYVLANETGTPFEDTGVVLRIISAEAPRRNARAMLSGDEEVPPVDTDAFGLAHFKFARDFSTLRYGLKVVRIENVLAAHIHCAPQGVNGPVGVTLFSDGPVTVNGLLVRDTVTAPDEGNACGWETLEDVALAIRNGYAYVNVHTTAYPSGEIRGQVE